VTQGPVLDEGRETLGTTALDGRPAAILEMPEDSILPLLLALSLLLVSYALLDRLWIPLAIGVVLAVSIVCAWFWKDDVAEASPRAPRESAAEVA
jgi:hypothetical protein